jgi:hypothetical protein
MAPGCKPGGLTPYVGSNPTPCTSEIADGRISDYGFKNEAQMLFQSAFHNPKSAMDGRE